ncbi:PEP-CTERM sorting domain-containing protein [Roseateles sp.]|uniref:PEP-CTERM sorting domain-containing protein n=1 Tax=Roseateles sp. TaxID=1971397 RepID=UPI002E16BC3C
MKSLARIALAGAMVMAVGAQSARAATPAVTAELKQVHVELIDLDPTDGITPWISFHDGAGVSLLGQVSPWGPSSLAADGAPLGGAASITATAALPSTFVHAEASAGDLSIAGAGPALTVYGDLSQPEGQMLGYAGIGAVFTVSAKTRVILSAQPGHIEISLNPQVFGSIWAMTNVGFCPLNAQGQENCFDQATLTDLSVSDYAGEIRTLAGNSSFMRQALAITWDNAGVSEQDHYLWANALVVTQPMSAPVPEPSQALLLVAGLALIGRMSARRR